MYVQSIFPFLSLTITNLQNGYFFMCLIDTILKNLSEKRYLGLGLAQYVRRDDLYCRKDYIPKRESLQVPEYPSPQAQEEGERSLF